MSIKETPLRKIGLHLRLTSTLSELAQKAASLQMPIFQCFLIHQVTNQFISPSDAEIKEFLTQWRGKFNNLYVHGSYWINLASPASHNKIILREIELAKNLEFTHIIVHSGSVRQVTEKSIGIGVMAKNLNALLKKENQIKVVLENTAHAGLSIGGDFNDFFQLSQHLDHPEKVLFCVDTAHAFVYGYPIDTSGGQAQFLEIIKETIGFNRIALIHLNDTSQPCQSRLDKHEKIGTGLLGNSLESFISHPSLRKVPIIMELPLLIQEEEKAVLEMVRSWKNKE